MLVLLLLLLWLSVSSLTICVGVLHLSYSVSLASPLSFVPYFLVINHLSTGMKKNNLLYTNRLLSLLRGVFPCYLLLLGQNFIVVFANLFFCKVCYCC